MPLVGIEPTLETAVRYTVKNNLTTQQSGQPCFFFSGLTKDCSEFKALYIGNKTWEMHFKGGRVGIWASSWGLGDIDGLLVPPGKASNLLTDHPITGHSVVVKSHYALLHIYSIELTMYIRNG